MNSEHGLDSDMFKTMPFPFCSLPPKNVVPQQWRIKICPMKLPCGSVMFVAHCQVLCRTGSVHLHVLLPRARPGCFVNQSCGLGMAKARIPCLGTQFNGHFWTHIPTIILSLTAELSCLSAFNPRQEPTMDFRDSKECIFVILTVFHFYHLPYPLNLIDIISTMFYPNFLQCVYY